MQANRGSDTRPEVAVRSELHRRGFRYRKHRQPLRGLRCRADIVFGPERVAVFIDGCFWHDCPEHGRRPRANGDWWRLKVERNAARDRRNDRVLGSSGWTVIRAWEHEPAAAVANRVAAAVMGQRTNGLRA